MNSIADIDDYDSFNFHYASRFEQSRPMQLTTQSLVYSLDFNEKGYRQFVYNNADGKPIASPRSLLSLCVNKCISNEKLMQRLDERTVSANIFAMVFKEAVLFGEYSLIAHLIAIWPNTYLKLSDLISNEIISMDTLSRPLFSCGPTILDYVLLGILISKASSRLRVIDFTGFHKDLKLTREIAHLSLLWLRPENRNYQNISNKIKARCCKCISSLLNFLFK